MGVMWGEEAIRSLAGERHGLVDRATALRLGATDDVIQGQLETRRWRRPHPGVYYLDTTRAEWETKILGAVMAAGAHAAASHRTATVLWGLDGVRTRLIELTVPFTKEPMPSGVTVHRTRRSRPSAFVGPVPVTTVERTLLDLAALVPDRTLEKALMSALHRRLTTLAAVDLTVGTQGGRGVKGTRRLRRVLERAEEGITASVAEVDMSRIIADAPIPPPVTQKAIALPDVSNAYPDFSWPARMKIVEVDGYESHGSPEAMHSDLIRQNQLMDLGWEIRRFSARRIRDEPEVVRAELVAFIGPRWPRKDPP